MSNPDFQWFPLMARDWMTDSRIMLMPRVASGCFIDLLCVQWEDEYLPEILEELAVLTRPRQREMLAHFALRKLEEAGTISAGDLRSVTVEEFFQLEVWPYLEELLPTVGPGRQNRKLAEIRSEVFAKARRKSDAARQAGRASAARRRRSTRNSAQNGQSDRVVMPQLRTDVERTLNHRARAGDAHPDAHPDEDEEKRVDSKPSTPSPPVPNPGPPERKSPAPVRVDWEDFVARWNELAAAEDLPEVRSLSETRKRKARALIARIRRRGGDWFQILSAGVRHRRGTWARENRFPTLDQALREEIVDKLTEGFYERDREARSLQPAHLNRQSDFQPTDGPTRVKIIRPEDRR